MMCGRYYIEEDDGALAQVIEKAQSRKGSGENIKTGEIFPTDIVPVICNNKRLERSVFPMRWGFYRPQSSSTAFNARIETAGSSSFFGDSFRNRRCVIPASCYFEWKSEGKRKIKYKIRAAADRIVYMAGIYTTMQGEDVPRFAVLTCNPTIDIAGIHDRMPVMIPPDGIDEWLNSGKLPADIVPMRASSV
ncbi:MAG: SOS response-associated peptidase [Clostridiales bacterium]|nr:SOS response-associated peptidase [Clostridiales bacterium]